MTPKRRGGRPRRPSSGQSAPRLSAEDAEYVVELAAGDPMSLLSFVSVLMANAYRAGEIDCARRIEVMIEDGHPVTYADGGT